MAVWLNCSQTRPPFIDPTKKPHSDMLPVLLKGQEKMSKSNASDVPCESLWLLPLIHFRPNGQHGWQVEVLDDLIPPRRMTSGERHASFQSFTIQMWFQFMGLYQMELE